MFGVSCWTTGPHGIGAQSLASPPRAANCKRRRQGERMLRCETAQVDMGTESVGLIRRGRLLEGATLAWNVIGIVVLVIAAVGARSVALAGFGFDSLIEIGASVVVLWELSGNDERRQQRALRLIAWAFVLLAVYLSAQSAVVLVQGHHARHSVLGIVWTAMTAAVMFALAPGKRATGRRLGNAVLVTEGRVTLIDGVLACAVLLGLALNAAAGLWWADPAAGLVIVYYAIREAGTILLKE